MKKGLMTIAALTTAFTLAACATTQAPKTTTTPEPTVPSEEVQRPKDGSYTSYMTYYDHPAYLATATVTVKDGKATGYTFEECHLPDHWATFTEEEIAGMDESNYIPGVAVTGAKGYYAKSNWGRGMRPSFSLAKVMVQACPFTAMNKLRISARKS